MEGAAGARKLYGLPCHFRHTLACGYFSGDALTLGTGVAKLDGRRLPSEREVLALYKLMCLGTTENAGSPMINVDFTWMMYDVRRKRWVSVRSPGVRFAEECRPDQQPHEKKSDE